MQMMQSMAMTGEKALNRENAGRKSRENGIFTEVGNSTH